MSLGYVFLVSLVGSVVGSIEPLRRQLLQNVARVCKACNILHRCIGPKCGSESRRPQHDLKTHSVSI